MLDAYGNARFVLKQNQLSQMIFAEMQQMDHKELLSGRRILSNGCAQTIRLEPVLMALVVKQVHVYQLV